MCFLFHTVMKVSYTVKWMVQYYILYIIILVQHRFRSDLIWIWIGIKTFLIIIRLVILFCCLNTVSNPRIEVFCQMVCCRLLTIYWLLTIYCFGEGHWGEDERRRVQPRICHPDDSQTGVECAGQGCRGGEFNTNDSPISVKVLH